MLKTFLLGCRVRQVFRGLMPSWDSYAKRAGSIMLLGKLLVLSWLEDACGSAGKKDLRWVICWEKVVHAEGSGRRGYRHEVTCKFVVVCRCLISFNWIQNGVWMQATGCGSRVVRLWTIMCRGSALWRWERGSILLENTWGELSWFVIAPNHYLERAEFTVAIQNRSWDSRLPPSCNLLAQFVQSFTQSFTQSFPTINSERQRIT